jgi:hypothetical protein
LESDRSSFSFIIGRIVFAILSLLSLVFLVAASARAQEVNRSVAQVPGERRALDPLNADEQAVAERIARNDGRVKELLGATGVRLVSVTPVMIKTGPPEKIDVAQRQIEVVLFRPQGEVGARVVVNLRQNAVVAVGRMAGDQVPFTNDDLTDAFQLALKDPEVLRALGPAAKTFQPRTGTPGAAVPENSVGGLPIRSDEPSDPCSKHRCMRLTFRRGNDYLSEPIVTVDITAQHVYVERPATDRKEQHQ